MWLRSGCSLNNLCFGTEAACGQVPRLYRQMPDNNKKRVKKTSQAQADSPTCLRHYTIRWKRALVLEKRRQEAKSVIYLTFVLYVFMRDWLFLESHGGAKIKFVGEAFNIVGDMGEGKNSGGSLKNRGGAQKRHGESFRGGCYRGVW